MRKSKFTEEQIIKVLSEVEAGAKVQGENRDLKTPVAALTLDELALQHLPGDGW